MRKNELSFWIAFACLGALCCPARTRAQQYDPNYSTGLPQTIYHGSDLDTVDLMTGNLKISIPLLRLRGRGIDTVIQLTYNSKIWTTWQSTDPNTGDEWYFSAPSGDANGMSPAGGSLFPNAVGWGAGIARMGHFGPYTLNCPYPPNNCSETEDWVMSDGTVVPMVDDVGLENCQTVGCPATGKGLWSFVGDYTRFPGVPGVVPSQLTTGYYKDGTKVSEIITGSGSTYTQNITDTNGNLISCVVSSPYTTQTCTDTLGRVITYNYGSSHHELQSMTYKDSSGTLQTIAFSYQNQVEHYPVSWLTVGANWSADCNGPCTSTTGGGLTLASITLPNGRSYQFQYLASPDGDGSSTGILTQITLPTGGYIKYTWGWLSGNGSNAAAALDVPATRTVSADGTVASEKTWTYSIQMGSSAPFSSQVTDPLGNMEVVTMDGMLNPTMFTFKDSASHVLKTVSRTLNWDQSAYYWPINCTPTPCTGARIASETTTLSDTNQQSGVTYTYGSRGNVAEKDEYDWGSGSRGSLIRKTTLSYLHDSNSSYDTSSVHILDRVTAKNICNPSSSFCSKVTITYDGATPSATSNVVGHDYSNYPSTFTLRGNPAHVQNWVNTTNTWLSTTNSYNDVGNLLQTTDPNNNTTSYSYGDNYYNYTPPQPASAFVSQVTNPVTNSVNHIERSQYYYNSGLLAATCRENFPGSATCVAGLAAPQSDYAWFTYDSLNRILASNFGDGGQTTISYHEVSLPISVSSSTKIDSSKNLLKTVVYDGLGRSQQSQLNSDPDCASGDKTDTTYDGLGRVYTVSNPYCTTGDSTYGLTTYVYDALGRSTKVIPPDGSASSDNVSTSYSGNSTTVTDQAGKSRKSVTDGLGRLAQVFEDPAALNYETGYTYDALDNLLTVNQKGGSTNSANWRTRTFTYDSLVRLLTTSNPESGTISYSYDSNGNLLTKVAPAPNQTGSATVTTTYSYDALNRLTQKSYSDGTTPTATFLYDVASTNGVSISNPVGRLVRALTLDGLTQTISSYDAMGRPSTQWIATPSFNQWSFITNYSYNLAGGMSAYTNGMGVTFTQTFDAAGRPSQLTSSLVDSQHPATLATVDPTVGYFPTGALKKITFGNSLTETAAYNNRLQPCRMEINSSATSLSQCTDAAPSGNLLDLTYGFNLGTANNGNVASWSSVGQQSFNRTYTYDSLNRIATMADSNSGQSCRGLSWTIDPWSNRTDQTVTSGTCNTFHQTVNTLNRLVGPPYLYDAAGNMTSDGNHTYTYDAENRLVSVDGGATATYHYDANGMRASKTAGGSETDFVRDLSGSVIAEWTPTGIMQGYWNVGHVYFNGGLVAEYEASTTYFVHKDHLGSTRLLTGINQTVVQNVDFLPFGEESSLSSAVPVVNPGFENGSTGWALGFWGCTSFITTTQAHSGGSSLAQSGSVTGGTYQDLGGVVSGNTYQVSAWVRADAGTSARAMLWVHDTTGGNSVQSSLFTPGTAWQQVTLTFTADNTNQLRIHLYFSAGSGTIYYDDVQVQMLNPVGDTNITTHKFTGKERDSESGLDNFGARYDSSSMGRFMSPDPLMASATVYDPQTWNRYTYALNNPLKFIDPTGMKEVTADQCAKDKNCVTVKVNVIYDSNANNGKGLTDQQKQDFQKQQLQNAKDQYGDADIRLDVTYTPGGFDDKGNLQGASKDSINVLVRDSGDVGVSGMTNNGYALTEININRSDKDTLSHELAHAFLGDTTGLVSRIAERDKTGIFGLVVNAFEDVVNDGMREAMKNPSPSVRASIVAPQIFNSGAKNFQQMLTQQAAIRPRQ